MKRFAIGFVALLLAAGSRDHTLADAPELDHTEVAEILWLIETLAQPR